MQLQPPIPRILSLLRGGNVIVVLGAGANARPVSAWDSDTQRAWRPEPVNPIAPTGRDLAHYLATLSSYPEASSQDELAKVAQYYAMVLGRTDLCRCLRDVFVRDYPITPLYRFLAELPPPQLLLTFNYDDVLERAFREAGHPFDIVIHHTDTKELAGTVLHWKHGTSNPEAVAPKRLLIDLDKTTVIYKIHGSIDRNDASRDSFVLDEDSYVDFLVRMGKQAAVPAVFGEPFMQKHFLFLGYSLRDWNFRVVFSKIERDWRRAGAEGPSSWAIQRKPSVVEQEFWKRRNVTIFVQSIDEFVEALGHEAVTV